MTFYITVDGIKGTLYLVAAATPHVAPAWTYDRARALTFHLERDAWNVAMHAGKDSKVVLQ